MLLSLLLMFQVPSEYQVSSEHTTHPGTTQTSESGGWLLSTTQTSGRSAMQAWSHWSWVKKYDPGNYLPITIYSPPTWYFPPIISHSGRHLWTIYNDLDCTGEEAVLALSLTTCTDDQVFVWQKNNKQVFCCFEKKQDFVALSLPC